MEYKYDDGGIRTEKTVNGTKTEFVTSGIQLLAQKSDEGIITWQIDGNGNVLGFVHNNQVYFYLKNAQGDIVGIADSTGTEVATYVYDSWGKLLSVKDENGVEIVDENHIGHKNPLRYRGYYYDEETQLYYLNARYYDPETGRFLNADDNLSDLNLYRYCGNNPINCFDPSGHMDIDAKYVVSNVRFTQDSVASLFQNPNLPPVSALIEELKSGNVLVENLPPLRLILLDGEVYSLDNRRLFAYKMAEIIDFLYEVEAELTFAQLEQIKNANPERKIKKVEDWINQGILSSELELELSRKWTTKDEGVSIMIREYDENAKPLPEKNWIAEFNITKVGK